MLRLGIESRQVVEFGAASGQETLLALDGNLLQGFQAVGCKAWAHHSQTPYTTSRQLPQQLIGVGLQPDLAAETGLETDAPLIGLQLQRGVAVA